METQLNIITLRMFSRQGTDRETNECTCIFLQFKAGLTAFMSSRTYLDHVSCHLPCRIYVSFSLVRTIGDMSLADLSWLEN